ncbi:MAG TPA: DnaJ domain-containing protein, partial [Polyangiaceae bacterium]|nr:DnaJ domain-containing protein [Polyangiaceae bacterium]
SVTPTTSPRPNTPSNIASIAPAAAVVTPPPDDASTAAGANESDAAALAEEVDLEPELQRQILALQRGLERLDHYALLGVERTADKKVIKRAYYDLAAKLHPDRHFRKKLGSFKFRMEAVFSRLTFAHDTLANPQKRAEYNAYLEENDRLRGIEQVLAGAAAEVRRAEDNIERQARAQEQRLAAPAPGPRMPPPAPPTSPPPNVDAAARREAFAKRLLGIRPSAPSSMPPPKVSIPPTPMTATDAMDALRRRYEERVSRAKASEARKYSLKAEEALASGKLVEAASSFRVASGLAPTDEALKRKSAEIQVKADTILSETYARQAAYEEKNGQWPEAARSWARTCQLRPNDAHSHDRAAAAIVKAGGDMHRAVHLAQRACELEPELPRMRVTLGNAYLAAGLGLNAKREFEVAAKLAPDDGTIKSLLKRVDHGEGK